MNRLKIVTNEKKIPALDNMIKAIYSGDGKYIFYCNDREIVYPDKLEKFMEFLEQRDLAFIHVIGYHKHTSNSYKIYSTAYESLTHQRGTHHPSGMVFNGDIIREKLPNKEKYALSLYSKEQYNYSYLMRDILQYGSSAIYDFGCWIQRPRSFLAEHRSGANTTNIFYFFPEVPYQNIKRIFEQVFNENKYDLTEKEKGDVAIYFGEFFYVLLINYKYCMWSITETAHYGIKPKFIPWITMHKIVMQFCDIVDKLLCDYGFDSSVKKRWRKERYKFYLKNLISNLKIDVKRVIFKRMW